MGVRQGDALSTMLFNLTLEASIRKLEISGHIGIKSIHNGKKLSNNLRPTQGYNATRRRIRRLNVILTGACSYSTTPPPPGKRSKTPIGADRFIPVRSATNFELTHYKVTQGQQLDDELISPSQKGYQRFMSEYLFGRDVRNMRLLSYKNKAPGRPDGFSDSLINMYSKAPASTKSSTRYIPKNPDRILDPPDIVDDYC
ncbi:cell division cycle protein 20 homolog [Zootermopsis nevadensis]|uniref:cell division cycle protein 20 homolog n=1 Tax=Zootermopsis nevadensis TaxID=136037 RepID=UPI000B8EDA0B|nr:cell division cycle protein 20 homolog [Zootermopsis nevadensis]